MIKVFNKIENKTKIILFFVSAIIILLNFYGMVYEEGYANLDLLTIPFFIIFIIVLFILYFLILFIYVNYENINNFIVNKEKENINIKKFYIINVLILLFFWGIVFLAYYPGIFSYDVMTQIIMSYGGYYTHHPLAHTFFINLFYYIGRNVLYNINAGIAIATIVQMIFLAVSITNLHLLLYSIKIKKNIIYLLTLFCALNPIYQMMSISHTKDIIFAGFMINIICALLDYILNKKLNNKFLIFSVVGFILFRNQGIYIVVMFLILCIFNKKMYPVLKNLIIGLFIAVVSLFILKISVNAGEGSKVEMLSVPIQGISRIYNNHTKELDSELKQQIEILFKDVDKYDPFISDPVKKTMSHDMSLFFKVFKNTIFRYPYEYFESFMLLNIGYYYLYDKNIARIYSSEEKSNYRSDKGLFITDTKEGFGVKNHSYIEPIEKLYEYLFTENKYYDNIFLKTIVSSALYLYILLFSFIIILLKKENSLYYVYFFIILFLITMSFGPCCLVRYAFPYIVVSLPLLIISFAKER